MTDHANSVPANDLLELIVSLSQRCYYAGWKKGIEGELWRASSTAGDSVIGHGTVTVAEKQLLRKLSALAGGWWVWEADSNDPTFVPTDILSGRRD